MSLAWQARQQDAPRHIWLRRAVVAAAAGMSQATEARGQDRPADRSSQDV